MIEIELTSGQWPQTCKATVRKAAEAAIAYIDKNNNKGLSIQLSDDADIQRLNRIYKDKDKPTNVLAFPTPAPHNIHHMGDIILAYSICQHEAVEQNKRLDDHISHLVVHGVLHLHGFDHKIEADAEIMEDHERNILATLNIEDPYAAI